MAVFKRRINQKITKALGSRRVETALYAKASSKFELAKNEFSSDIQQDQTVNMVDSNPFTRGYLGLYPDASPASELEFAILEKIQIRRRGDLISRDSKSATYRYNIIYPQRNQTYNDGILMLPWISKTWVEAIEQGIGNLERFLFRDQLGRSESGVQIKGSLNNGGEFTDFQLLDRLRNKFSARLRKRGL